MENQTNVRDQNTQQIGQNPLSQSQTLQEKQKVNYWMIISLILGFLFLAMMGINLFSFKTTGKKNFSVAPSPQPSIAPSSTAKSTGIKSGPESTLFPSPMTAITGRFTSYSVEELRQSLKINLKYDFNLNEDDILSDLQKIIRSFPGARYEYMNFTLNNPGFSTSGGYDIQIKGEGSIDNKSDYYSITYSYKESQLSRTGYSVDRFAIPKTFKDKIITALEQEEAYRNFYADNPGAEVSYIWHAFGDPPSRVITESGNVIYITVTKPCMGIGYSCINDRYSNVFSMDDDQFVRKYCPSACKSNCERSQVIDSGLFCTAKNSVCCVSEPQ